MTAHTRKTVAMPPHWSDEKRDKFLAWLNDELDKDEDRRTTREYLGSKSERQQEEGR